MPFVVTADQLAAIAGRSTPLMAALAEWMNTLCPAYEIDTPQEFCHFLAQACHETDHFKTLTEYASGRGYEGRADLGNTQPGDGVRFKGRGIFQTTGRANYVQLGVKKGRRDLFVNSPELLAQPEYAVWSACEFWKTRGLNDIANHADADVLKKKVKGKVIDVSPVEFISITINGGYNGMADRKKYYGIAQRVLVEAPAPRGLRGMPEVPAGRARSAAPAGAMARAGRKAARPVKPPKPAKRAPKPAEPAKISRPAKPSKGVKPGKVARAARTKAPSAPR